MKKEDPSDAPLAQLVRKYAHAAARHQQATDHGDHRLANRMATIIMRSYSELRRRG